MKQLGTNPIKRAQICVLTTTIMMDKKKSFQDYKATAKQTNKINKTPIVLILAYRFSTIPVKYHSCLNT